MALFRWIKNNKLTFVLAVIVFLFLFSSFVNNFYVHNTYNLSIPDKQAQIGAPYAGSTGIRLGPQGSFDTMTEDYAPQPDVAQRMVIRESNISLLVKNVRETQDKILAHTTDRGGYMVSTSLRDPSDAGNSTIVVRVPSDKLDQTMQFLAAQSVKVVSENLTGRDITDQHIDTEKRLQTLENTKTRFESILERAEDIQDITRLTQQILSYQNQIDALKGQQQAMEQNAQMAKLTIYLSTDELALPYSPSETWRAEAVFKQSVRSLVSTLRSVASFAIVVGVYSVIWVPALGAYVLIKRKSARNKRVTNNLDDE